MLTFPRFRGVDPPGCTVPFVGTWRGDRPNSSTVGMIPSSRDDCEVENIVREEEDVCNADAWGSRLELDEPLARRKPRPRIDLRPLLSSLSGVDDSRFGEGVEVDIVSATLPLEVFREKNGMPDGVRRELDGPATDLLGLVVTIEGVACAGATGALPL